MTEKDFLKLLQQYLKGECTDVEKTIIDQWYDNIRLGDSSRLNAVEGEVIEKQHLEAIAKHINQSGSALPEQKQRFLRYYILLGAAASLIILVLSFASFFIDQEDVINKSVPVSELSSWTVIKNSERIQKVIVLEDGSRITLQPDTEIKVSDSFNLEQREIELDGQAFFEIARNPEKPFVVFTDRVITKVLGTSFTVKAFNKHKEIVVAVKTGKVSVFDKDDHAKNPNHSPVILTPNQQLVYNRDEKRLTHGLVADPAPVLSPEDIERMHFEDARVTDVFEAMSRIYGIEINYEKAEFASCTVTTSIIGNSIYNRLDIICKAIGATYTVEGPTIIIHGPGCNATIETETK